MNTTETPRRSPQRHAAGFTLVELMVALALSMMLVVVMLKTQTTMAQQTVHNADSSVRDGEMRTALDVVGRSVSGAGFVLGGTQYQCNEMFTYNATAQSTSLFFTHHPVDAVAASNNLFLQFASGLQLDYPPSASIPTDVLAVTSSRDPSGFDLNNAPSIDINQNSAYTPSSTGVVPVKSSFGAAALHHVGILQSNLASRWACFRMSFDALGVANGSANVQTNSGTLMPSTFYNAFSPSMTTAGYGAFSDGGIFVQSQVVDMSANPAAATSVFYVDNNPAKYPFPVLMMATYNFADDTLDATGAQAIAAGVISLQVRFGVDPGKTGAVTAYEDAATVTSSNHWDVIRTTKILLISRSLTEESDLTPTTSIPACSGNQASTLTTPCIAVGSPAYNFKPITAVPSGAQNRRFMVSMMEIASRNLLWNCDGFVVCAK